MGITEELQAILDARYGKDVRQNIHDAIQTCYTDGKAGVIDYVARAALPNKADLENGKVKLSQIPEVALDNLIKVADDAARFALTKEEVQTGDTVKVLDTDLMYLVVDDTKLDSEDGYTGYSASVDWNTIAEKPDNIAFHDSTKTSLTDATATALVDEDGNVIAPKTLASQVYDAEGNTMLNMLTFDKDDTEVIEDVDIVKKSEIVNNLTSTDTDKPLSANMGKSLNDTLANKSSIFVKDYTVTLSASKTTDTAWNVTITQSGYTAMSYSIARGNSTSSSVTMGVEIFNSTKISGYYINKLSSAVTATIKVAYYKNS